MTTDELKKEAEEKFKEWKSEQYKDQSTEEKMEFVEHLHTFPKYFEKAFNGGYLASAEPREKHIAKLEKYKDSSEKYIKLLEGKLNENQSAWQKKYAELEQENAELKEINTHTLSQLNLDNGELIIENENLRKENAELQDKLKNLASVAEVRIANWQKYEKENAELKQACHKWFMRWREAKKDALYFDSSLQKQIEATLKLQQENAELKDNFKIAKDNEYEYSSLLTKAKEIIRELLSSCFGYNSKTVNYEVKAKAEAFLKE